MIPAAKRLATSRITLAPRLMRDDDAAIPKRDRSHTVRPQPKGGRHGTYNARIDPPSRAAQRPACAHPRERAALLQPRIRLAPGSRHAARGRSAAALFRGGPAACAMAEVG